jgi:copper chaperone NosL
MGCCAIWNRILDLQTTRCVLVKTQVRSLALTALILSAVVVLGCSAAVDISATPEIAYGEVICEQCGMIVSEESQAAAYRLPDGTLRIFDDLGDMVLYHRINGEDVHIFWVHDFQTGEWMHAPDAFYVATDDLVTPMGHGIAAFTFEAGAEHLAEEHGAPIYRWNDLVSDPLADLPRHID